MTVELHVFDACNLKCTYCYEKETVLTEGPISYDLDKMLQSAEKQGVNFTVFGGEPLLFPIPDLEKIFKFGYEKFKRNGIQTNGTLITGPHIDLFKRYNVHVGISIDGPGELNDARAVGTLASTRNSTARSERNIGLLIDNGITPSIISTIHRINAYGDRLGTLLRWFTYLDGIGVKHVRLHFLENDKVDYLRLTVKDSFTAFKELIELPLRGLKFDTFEEFKNLLTDTGPASCNWNGCDPYSTPAVVGIDGDGSLKNCGRTYKDGIAWRKSSTRTNIRQLALYNLPQEHGGCKDCSYFAFCKGECPGESKDWRDKSEQCELIKRLFAYVESRLKDQGIKVIDGARRKELELMTVGEGHLDVAHVDSAHLDTPHIDEHDDVYRFFVPIVPVYSHDGCVPDCHSLEHHHDAGKS